MKSRQSKSINRTWTAPATRPLSSSSLLSRMDTSTNVSKNPYKVIKKNIHPSTSVSTYNVKKPQKSVVPYFRPRKFFGKHINFSRYQPFHTNTFNQSFHSGYRKHKFFPAKCNPQTTKWTRTKKFARNIFKTSKSKNITLNRTKLASFSPATKSSPYQHNKFSFRQVQARQIVKKSRRRSYKKPASVKKITYCPFFNRFGKCHRGDACPHIHSRARVALCTRFLQGKCRRENCPFSHELSKSKLPVCYHYIRGTCGVENCPYLHVFVGKNAPICEQFATTGFCAKADSCKELHMRACPEFYENETCAKGEKCQLPHKRKPKTKKQIISEKNTAKRELIEATNQEKCQTVPKLSAVSEKEAEEDNDELLPIIPRLTTINRSSCIIQDNSLNQVPPSTSSDHPELPDAELRTVPRLSFRIRKL